MSIGSTSGKEPDYIPDEDLRTPEQLRGDMKEINKAKMTMVEKATVQGIATEIQVMKQQMEMQAEQMNRLIGMYATMKNEFDQFKAQRAIELNMKVNNGSTSPEDD